MGKNACAGQRDKWTDIIFSSCTIRSTCVHLIRNLSARISNRKTAEFRLHIKAHIFHEGRIKSEWNEWHCHAEITTVCHRTLCGRTLARQRIIYSMSWCAFHTFTLNRIFFYYKQILYLTFFALVKMLFLFSWPETRSRMSFAKQ